MFIGGRRLRGSLRLVPPPHPTRLLFSHARHQPAPATHWFAGVAQFQTGRRTPKDATLLLHRSVPPSVLVESCKTQLYQRAQNDAQLLFSTNGVFRVQSRRALAGRGGGLPIRPITPRRWVTSRMQIP